MEELQLLIQMVSNLPSMALWVLVGFWAYKVIIVGSVYGVIRYCVSKFVEWRTMPIQYKMEGITINQDVTLQVLVQLRRLADSSYFHSTDAKRLENAVNNLLEKEKFEGKK